MGVEGQSPGGALIVQEIAASSFDTSLVSLEFSSGQAPRYDSE